MRLKIGLSYPVLAAFLLLGLAADARGQPPSWLRATLGLDSIGALVIDGEVRDPSTRSAVLEAFAPGGPWLVHPPIDRPEPTYERLDEWPEEALVADFSGDGVPDVILSVNDPDIVWWEGRLHLEPVLAETSGWFGLYPRLDGRFVGVGREHGARLVGVVREHLWSPSTLRAVFTDCCDAWSLAHYVPVTRGDTLSYRLSLSVLPAYPGPVDVVFEVPRPFVVENSVYSLRSTPRIDPDPGWQPSPAERFGGSPALAGMDGPWEVEGNRLAVYERGARGVALASATDDTGRVWWYVLMSPDTPPAEPRFGGPVSLGGWMSSRFLEAVGGPP